MLRTKFSVCLAKLDHNARRNEESFLGAGRWVGLYPVLLTAGYQSAGDAGILWLMQYGRIVRITYTLGGPYATYIVAEENAAKASAVRATRPDDKSN